ncbi:carbon-nitrogen family hydrolase [Arthrobacter mobilis]|uniref:Carbon-nitrogen family hydrolase n=1 Tax=Arthrobacter mobilis TaxID=2724944 RepID=A0A7X6HEM7_9MICC|nr:carbon-nitrogen family hydrolase [Arthrobacter mobilis]NKX55738.1 carbon-nitrogen family hydrolase [Arthrobacter mobilis]
MKVALVQVASPDGEDRQGRIERVERTLRGIQGADLIVLPELWSAGYFHFDQYEALAETLDGPTVSMCSRVAAELGVHLHLGSIVERAANGQLKNTSILLDPQGRIAHQYSKIHVFGYQSLEASLLTAGSSLLVAETPFGRVTGTTCYDLRFPGLWLELSNRGVEIVIVPAAWPAARREHWRLLTSARAVEHQIFVIACNAVGEQEGVELGGHSRVVDPSGAVLAECGADEQVLMVEIDPEQVARVRKEFPVIADRLPAYDNLTN